ncbi:MAG: sel1 repeat family protein [Alphaproteobacteria bacterium]|nr:MAG: sel1 repeat family protein [Alphaproteobacteria bacterium]
MSSEKCVAFILLMALPALTGCAGGGGNPREQAAQRLEQVRQIPTVDVSSRLYTQALEMKAAGNCAGAIPGFYALAQRGAGYELAQYHLADCLLAGAPRSLSATRFLDGLVWMRRAAEAGSPEAQGALALLYLDGPAGLRDAAEAAFWYELSLANPAAKRPGFTPLDRSKRERLEAALSPALRAAARERIQGWQKVVWSAPKGALSPAGESILGGGRQGNDGDQRRHRRRGPPAG